MAYISIQLGIFFYQKRYVAKNPAPDSLTYITVLGLNDSKEEISNAQICVGQQDAIWKMTKHLEQLYAQQNLCKEQIVRCTQKHTTPEFEQLTNDIKKSKKEIQ